LVQLEDDPLYNLPLIPHSNFILQGDPLTNHGLDIRVTHDPIELRMIEVFRNVDLKSFGSSIFLLITGELPHSKFQPIIFNDFLSSKHPNASFHPRRLHNWLH
jgi:hypothetical protein